MTNNYQQVLSLAQQHGLIRPRDLDAQALPRVALTRLVKLGKLIRVGRDQQISEHSALAEVARKYPQSVICLLSALRVHNLTMQTPFEV